MQNLPKALTDAIQKTSVDLRLFDNIFEDNLIKFPPVVQYRPTPDGRAYYYVYWPKYSGRDPKSGLNLKNSHGFITIEEIYRVVNAKRFEKVGFTYRYINPYHEYLVSFSNGVASSSDTISNYSFRFDKIFEPAKKVIEPPEHLQVLHQVPRFSFPANYITAQIFMQTIKDTCYNTSGVSFETSFHASSR